MRKRNGWKFNLVRLMPCSIADKSRHLIRSQGAASSTQVLLVYKIILWSDHHPGIKTIRRNCSRRKIIFWLQPIPEDDGGKVGVVENSWSVEISNERLAFAWQRAFFSRSPYCFC